MSDYVVDVYDSSGNMIAEGVEISIGSSGPSKPQRINFRKIFSIFGLVTSLMAISGIIISIFQQLENATNLKVLILSSIMPIIFLLVFSLICILFLKEMNYVTKQINTIYLTDKEKQDIETKTVLSVGEKIDLKNCVPSFILEKAKKNLKDEMILKAIDISLGDFKKYSFKVTRPEKEWLIFRKEYIKNEGSKYNGKGKILEDVNGIKQEIGVSWYDLDDEPIFEYYGLEDTSIPLSSIINSYIDIKFKKLLKAISYLSILLYPILIVSILMAIFIKDEMIYYSTNSALLLLGFIIFLINFVDKYKKYKQVTYIKKDTLIIRMLGILLIGFILSYLIFNFMNEIMPIFYVMIFATLIIHDMVTRIDIKLQKTRTEDIRNAHNNGYEYLPKVHYGVIFATILIGGLIALLTILCLSITIPIVKNSILDFDNGISNDLSISIAFWSISGVISIILIAILCVIFNRRAQKKDKLNAHSEYQGMNQ